MWYCLFNPWHYLFSIALCRHYTQGKSTDNKYTMLTRIFLIVFVRSWTYYPWKEASLNKMPLVPLNKTKVSKCLLTCCEKVTTAGYRHYTGMLKRMKDLILWELRKIPLVLAYHPREGCMQFKYNKKPCDGHNVKIQTKNTKTTIQTKTKAKLWEFIHLTACQKIRLFLVVWQNVIQKRFRVIMNLTEAHYNGWAWNIIAPLNL